VQESPWAFCISQLETRPAKPNHARGRAQLASLQTPCIQCFYWYPRTKLLEISREKPSVSYFLQRRSKYPLRAAAKRSTWKLPKGVIPGPPSPPPHPTPRPAGSRSPLRHPPALHFGGLALCEAASLCSKAGCGMGPRPSPGCPAALAPSPCRKRPGLVPAWPCSRAELFALRSLGLARPCVRCWQEGQWFI